MFLSRGLNMIFAVGKNKRESKKAPDDRLPGFGTCKALQYFLQDNPGRYDVSAVADCMEKRLYFLTGERNIPAESEGPYAGIRKQDHRLLRSLL